MPRHSARSFMLFSRTLLCASALAATTAQAAPNLPLGPVALPPLPGSGYAVRLQAQQREARLRIPRDGPFTPNPTAYGAADFAALPASNWQIRHQDITVEVDPVKPTLTTVIKATIRANKSGIAELAFLTQEVDEVQAFDASGKGLEAGFSAVGQGYGVLTVELPNSLTSDADEVVEIKAVAPLDCDSGNIGLTPCSFDATFQSVVLYRYYLSSADVMHSPFKSDLHVITPANKVAAAPGEPSGPETLPDGRKLWTFKQLEQTDNAGFSIAAYQPLVEPATGELPNLRVFSVSPWAANAPTLMKMAKDITLFYGDSFVPFPWLGLNLIQLQSDFGGGYAPLGAAFLLREVFGVEPGDTGGGMGYGMGWQDVNELVAHEIGHQWWGNLVAPLGNGDVSLSESMAEFSSCLYTEKALGNRLQILNDNLSYVYTVPPASDKPMGSPTVYYSPAYVPIVYHKGAVVLDMLRRELGDAAMLDALAAYATTFARDYARIDDLRKVVEKATGRELGWFFKQWFLGVGAIRAELAARADPAGDGTWRLRLRITQGSPTMRFKLPVTVDFHGAEPQQIEVEVNPNPGDNVAIVEVIVPARPRRVRPDPQRTLLRAFAVGTPGDANLSGLVDGADLVDLAFRHGRAVVFKAKNGAEYFMPDPNWNELYDLAPNYAVDNGDVDELETWFGAEAEAF